MTVAAPTEMAAWAETHETVGALGIDHAALHQTVADPTSPDPGYAVPLSTIVTGLPSGVTG